MSECVILDVTDADEWKQRTLGYYLETDRPTLPLIPEGKRPTVMQPDRDTAEREASRLCRRFPGRRFAVLELAGVVQAKEVPTHVTLGGAVVASALRPVWDERPATT